MQYLDIVNPPLLSVDNYPGESPSTDPLVPNVDNREVYAANMDILRRVRWGWWVCTAKYRRGVDVLPATTAAHLKRGACVRTCQKSLKRGINFWTFFDAMPYNNHLDPTAGLIRSVRVWSDGWDLQGLPG